MRKKLLALRVAREEGRRKKKKRKREKRKKRKKNDEASNSGTKKELLALSCGHEREREREWCIRGRGRTDDNKYRKVCRLRGVLVTRFKEDRDRIYNEYAIKERRSRAMVKGRGVSWLPDTGKERGVIGGPDSNEDRTEEKRRTPPKKKGADLHRHAENERTNSTGVLQTPARPLESGGPPTPLLFRQL
jgi:hypothetical protein